MKREDTEFIVIHCSATRPASDIGVEQIRKWHMDRGWRDVGYHYVIRRNGDIEPGRDHDEVGAHVKGFNRVSLGICLVGGLNQETLKPEMNFTDQQMYSLYTLLRHNVTVQYPLAQVLGHRELSPDQNGDGVIDEWEFLKMCPCFDAADWWEDICNGDAPVPPGDG